MKHVAIIMPYFGVFKDSMALYLESCKRNPEIDWFIFTDNEAPKNLAENIHWNIASLADVCKLATQKLGCEVSLERPYKLCDLKAFYGSIFWSYIKEYEYWGFGDTDVIVGRLMPFLQKIKYQEYDKINSWGHLTLIRNTAQFTNAYKVETKSSLEWKTVLQSKNNIGFDERDYNEKFIQAGGKVYDGKWAADIDCHYKRMRCVDIMTIRTLCKVKRLVWAPRNYSKQLFVIYKGSVLRLYLKGTAIAREEFAYIHFRKEVPCYLSDIRASTFLITRTGFYSLPDNVMNDAIVFKRCVNRFNKSPGWLKEAGRYLFFWCYRAIKG